MQFLQLMVLMQPESALACGYQRSAAPSLQGPRQQNTTMTPAHVTRPEPCRSNRAALSLRVFDLLF